MLKYIFSSNEQKRLHFTEGFTVVELIIVIVVIGILATITITQFSNISARSRDTERKTDIAMLSAQLEHYYGRTGGYPRNADLNALNFRENNKISVGNDRNMLADPKSPTNYTLALSITPNTTYGYVPGPTGCVSPTSSSGTPVPYGGTDFCSSYTLVARLENLNDPDRDLGASSSTVAYYIKRNAAN